MYPLRPVTDGFLTHIDVLKSVFADHQHIAIAQCMLPDSFGVHKGAVGTVQVFQYARRRIANDPCMVGTGKLAVDLDVIICTAPQAQPCCVYGVRGRRVAIQFD